MFVKTAELLETSGSVHLGSYEVFSLIAALSIEHFITPPPPPPVSLLSVSGSICLSRETGPHSPVFHCQTMYRENFYFVYRVNLFIVQKLILTIKTSNILKGFVVLFSLFVTVLAFKR